MDASGGDPTNEVIESTDDPQNVIEITKEKKYYYLHRDEILERRHQKKMEDPEFRARYEERMKKQSEAEAKKIERERIKKEKEEAKEAKRRLIQEKAEAKRKRAFEESEMKIQRAKQKERERFDTLMAMIAADRILAARVSGGTHF